MATTIKAIETVYNGYRFRSRLEARWAVFMDTANVKYEYEPEGFDIDGTRYLPDFWLPDMDAWLEIKGELIGEGDEGWRKAQLLCEASGDIVFVFCGQFPNSPDNFLGLQFLPLDQTPVHVWWYACPICGFVGIGRTVADLSCDCLRARPPETYPVVLEATQAARSARFERF